MRSSIVCKVWISAAIRSATAWLFCALSASPESTSTCVLSSESSSSTGGASSGSGWALCGMTRSETRAKSRNQAVVRFCASFAYLASVGFRPIAAVSSAVRCVMFSNAMARANRMARSAVSISSLAAARAVRVISLACVKTASRNLGTGVCSSTSLAIKSRTETGSSMSSCCVSINCAMIADSSGVNANNSGSARATSR